MGELETALKTLETAGRKLESYESQTEIIGTIFGDDMGRTRVLELAKSGAMDGILGHLDDVIDFETKFEAPVRAISQRWNNALQSGLSQQLIDFQGEINIATGNLSLNQEKLKTNDEKSSDFLSALEDLDSNIKTLEASRESENDSLRSLSRSIDDSKVLRSKLMAELETALNTLETAGRKLDSYESQTDIIGKIFGDDVGRTRIVELSKSGAVGGILGHLDDIIDFEAKFEAPVRAISQRWNNALLCKDIPSMVEVIALGKKLRVKRFALIPISEIKNSKRAVAPDQAGILGNLADYVNAPAWADGLRANRRTIQIWSCGWDPRTS